MVSPVQLRVFLLQIFEFLKHKFEIVQGYPISIWEVFLFIDCFDLMIIVVQRILGKDEVV